MKNNGTAILHRPHEVTSLPDFANRVTFLGV